MIQAHVSQYKKEELGNLENLIQKYSIVGIIDITNLPSSHLQKFRSQLKNKLIIKVTKKSLIVRAIDNTKDKKQGLEGLQGVMDDICPALIFSNEDPFKIVKIVNKSKSSAPAKAGQKAPKDLIIPVGPTDFTPGPIIGELGQLGIKTSVDSGKIVVKEEKVLVKKDQEINPKAADILLKLGIEPMEVGLNIIALFEKGTIFDKEILLIDEEEYLNQLKLASKDAFLLALFIGYPTKENIMILLQKSQSETLALQSFIEPRMKESNIANNENESKESKSENVEMKEENIANNEHIIISNDNIYQKKDIIPDEAYEKAKDIIEKLTDQAIREKKKSGKKPSRVPTISELTDKKEEKKQGG